jgi:hypothetical protein
MDGGKREDKRRSRNDRKTWSPEAETPLGKNIKGNITEKSGSTKLCCNGINRNHTA